MKGEGDWQLKLKNTGPRMADAANNLTHVMSSAAFKTRFELPAVSAHIISSATSLLRLEFAVLVANRNGTISSVIQQDTL